MKKGAIFDMDGVLFDTERLFSESWAVIAQEFGYEPNETFARAVSGSSGQMMKDIVHRYYPEVDEDAFIKAEYDRVRSIVEVSVPEKAGIHEILQFFKENEVKIAVASSSSITEIENNLRNAGIREYFDVISSGTEVEYGKPAPDIFLLTAERLGLKATDCYVFEDSTNGVRAGHAAGCETIMVVDLTMPTEELRSISKVYDSMVEVLDDLKQGNV